MKKFPKVIEIKDKAKKAPNPVKVARIVIGSIVSLATAAATIIYLLNKFHGDFDLSKVPTPDQILNFKKNKAE